MLINLRFAFDCTASVKSLKSTFNSTKMEFGWLQAFIITVMLLDARAILFVMVIDAVVSVALLYFPLSRDFDCLRVEALLSFCYFLPHHFGHSVGPTFFFCFF